MKNTLSESSFVPKQPVSFQHAGSIRMIGAKVMFQTSGYGNPNGDHYPAKTGRTLSSILTLVDFLFGQVSTIVVNLLHTNGHVLHLISDLWIYAASPKMDIMLTRQHGLMNRWYTFSRIGTGLGKMGIASKYIVTPIVTKSNCYSTAKA